MHRPRKRFGQHFLHDEFVIQNIIHALSPKKTDNIVEIGPGRGALTFPLFAVHPNLIAIEIDRDLVKSLKQRLPLNLYEGDVLDFDFSILPTPLRIVGNLPYNISTPLLFYLLKFKSQIKDMTFMLQKEVVDRICAEPNTPDYGRLSVMIQHDFIAQSLFDVPKTAFNPPPKVESAVIRLIPKPSVSPLDPVLFGDIVREAFQYRRKTLRHALATYFTEEMLLECGISPKSRPGELTLHDFEKLTEYRHGKGNV